jgi:hypothetical protein
MGRPRGIQRAWAQRVRGPGRTGQSPAELAQVRGGAPGAPEPVARRRKGQARRGGPGDLVGRKGWDAAGEQRTAPLGF